MDLSKRPNVWQTIFSCTHNGFPVVRKFKFCLNFCSNFWTNYFYIVPGLLFALIGGALSDEFGNKGLLLFPLFGFFIETFFLIVNYVFIETLPLEFFYVDCISGFFGGGYVYYIGTFGFLTCITTPEDRAYRLAR